MSKVISITGEFRDVSGETHSEINLIHGQVFFNADDPDYVLVIAEDEHGVEQHYTTPHSEVLNGALIRAGASYRSLGIVN